MQSNKKNQTTAMVPFRKERYEQQYLPPHGMMIPPGLTQNMVLTNPYFNLREICKHLLLVEDHLNHVQKRCPDCITKHFLMIEALADEMSTLCTDAEMCLNAQQMATYFKELHHSLHRGADPLEVANVLRMARKQLCARLYGYGQG